MSITNGCFSRFSEGVVRRAEFLRKLIRKNVVHIRHCNKLTGHRMRAVATLERVYEMRMMQSNMREKSVFFGRYRRVRRCGLNGCIEGKTKPEDVKIT